MNDSYLIHYGVKGMKWRFKKTINQQKTTTRNRKIQLEQLKLSAKKKAASGYARSKKVIKKHGKTAVAVAAGVTAAGVGARIVKNMLLRKQLGF